MGYYLIMLRTPVAPCALILLLTALALPLALAQEPCTAPLGKKSVSVRLPGHPFEPIFSLDGCIIFVSLAPEGEVAVLQRTKSGFALRHLARIGGRPTAMVLSHDGRWLLAADFDRGLVDVLDAAALARGHGNSMHAQLGAGQLRGAVYINITPDDRYVLVSDERGAAVSVLDLNGGRVIGTIPSGLAPIALTISPDGRWLFMTAEIAAPAWRWPVRCPRQADAGRKAALVAPDGAVLVADMQRVLTDPAHAVTNIVPAGCSPVRLVLSPEGSTAYVTARSDDAVLAFSVAKLEERAAHPQIGSVRVGTAPVGVAAVGHWVIATDSDRFSPLGNGQLDLIPADAFITAGTPKRRTLGAGRFPRELRLSPSAGILALTNFGSQDIEFLNLARVLPKN